MSNGPKIKGLFRVNIVNPDGTVAGDSGFVDNLVSGHGGVNDILNRIVDNNYTAVWEYLALGSGGSLSWNSSGAETLPNENEAGGNPKRLDINGTSGSWDVSIAAASTATGTAASRLNIEATFASNYYSAAKTVGNIGLFMHSTEADCMAGNTFASSALATDQAMYVTYQIRISQ